MHLRLVVTSLAVLAGGAASADVCAIGNATCGNHGAGLAQDHLLLQKDRLAIRRSVSRARTKKGSCTPSEVSRRRRQDTMCACRRRSGPTCVDKQVVLEGSAEVSIKVMSYNLFGWNAFNINSWKKENIMRKIVDWDPAVLGAQEVEKGGWGYEEVRDDVVETTGLEHIGGSQFHKSSVIEQLETESTSLPSGYWASMTRFRHKKTQAYFLFFNSHWKHGHGLEQAKIVANFIQEQREKYFLAPAVLVGDSNQFCHGHDSDAWRYLMGKIGSSPVVFEDALAHDEEKSYSDGCRVDMILISKGEWIVRQADIDRDDMGTDGAASDHAPLMAELVPSQ